MLGRQLIATLVCDRRGAIFRADTMQALCPLPKAAAASPYQVRRLQLAFLEFYIALAELLSSQPPVAQQEVSHVCLTRHCI